MGYRVVFFNYVIFTSLSRLHVFSKYIRMLLCVVETYLKKRNIFEDSIHPQHFFAKFLC